MALNHVAQGTGLLVERAPATYANRLGGGDLHVVHIAAIPERFKDAVAKAEGEDVLHGLLAQVVIDAVNVVFREHPLHHFIQGARRFKVMPEGLLDHQTPVAGSDRVRRLRRQPRGSELFDHRRVVTRLGGKVIEDVAARGMLRFHLSQLLLDRGVTSRVVHISGDVMQLAGELFPKVLVEDAVFEKLLHTLVHLLAERVVRQRGARVADDGKAGRQPSFIGQAIERR